MGLMPDPSFPGSWIPDAERREKLIPVAAAIAHVLTVRPGIGVRRLRAAVRDVLRRCTDADTDAALYLLGEGVERNVATRGAHEYRVDIDRVPVEVRAYLATLNATPVKS